MPIPIELIQRLREETHLGVMDCRRALETANGDLPQARRLLDEQAAAEAALRAGRAAPQGAVELYSHANGKIGVMVEINTETDFAARAELFRAFAHEVALHIAAEKPLFVSEADIPAEILEEETRKAEHKARAAGKPETLWPRIVTGALEKWKDQRVLLRQRYIRDESVTIADLLHRVRAASGENVVIRRFERWELNDGAQAEE